MRRSRDRGSVARALLAALLPACDDDPAAVEPEADTHFDARVEDRVEAPVDDLPRAPDVAVPLDATTAFDAGATSDATTSPPDVAPSVDVPAAVSCAAASERAAAGFTDLTPSVMSLLPSVPPEPTSGVAVISYGVFGDLDGDGAVDVSINNETGPDAPRVLRYDVATRALAPIDGPWRVWPRAIRAALDLDGDGRDDLVGTLDMTLTTPVLWGGTAASTSLVETRGPLIAASLWFDDVDHDGWLDVLAGDEAYGCGMIGTVRTFLQARRRTFRERAAMVPSRVRIGGGALLSGTLGARYMVATIGGTHSCKTAGESFFVEGPRDAEGYPTFTGARAIADEFGGPMGATLADFDQDGAFDLAITTDPSVMIWRGADVFPLRRVDDAYGTSLLRGRLTRAQLPWVFAYLDVDRDGALDAVVTHGNHALDPGETPIGPQWTSVHRGAVGTPCLREVVGGYGLSRDGGWITLSVGDIDRDGDADFVVGGRGETSRIYRNDLPDSTHGLSVRLHGTTSNPLGIGARIESRVTPTSPRQVQVVGGVAGTVLTTPLAFVGVGAASSLSELTVRWPSGTVQVLRDLAAGRMHDVTEPAVLTVEPADRHLPADGASVARLRVTPRDATGAARSGAVVTARSLAGGVAPTVVAQADGTAVVSLTAPRVAGSSVVEVSVDGVPVAVRPRVWWD